MSMSEPTPMSKPAAEPVRRIEVFTGAGRRRVWTAEEKTRIVAESYGEGESVCGVARRHSLTPQQLFTWRREARRGRATRKAAPAASFVPAVVVAPPAQRERSRPKPTRRPAPASASIELAIDGVTVRIGRGAEARTVAAVIRALKAGT